MMRSCMDEPTYCARRRSSSAHAASSACSSCESDSTIALGFLLRLDGDAESVERGRRQVRRILKAAPVDRRTKRAQRTVDRRDSWPFRYAALNRRMSPGFSSAVTGRSPSTALIAFSRPLIVAGLRNPSPRVVREVEVEEVRDCQAYRVGSRCHARIASSHDSARNFGSHTRSAVCLDVTGSAAPRTSAKSSTRMRLSLRTDIEVLKSIEALLRVEHRPHSGPWYADSVTHPLSSHRATVSAMGPYSAPFGTVTPSRLQ